MSKYSRLAALSKKSPDEQPPERKDDIPEVRNNATTQQRNKVVADAQVFDDDFLVAVCRSVSHPHEVSSNYRLSRAEKDRFDSLLLSLKQDGFRKANGVELLRATMTAILEDYDRNGEQSLIYKVFQKLYHNTYG